MYSTYVLNVLRGTIFVLGSLLCWGGQVCASEDQGSPPAASFENPREAKSERIRRAAPFADYERRLRQSLRWQTMSPEEQEKALEKIERARKQFIDQQQQLNMRYNEQIKKMEKPRESLMSKRSKREQFQDINFLWERLQGLPETKRLAVERQLGLDRVMSSQQQQQFQEHFDKLSYSKRKHILRQLQQTSP